MESEADQQLAVPLHNAKDGQEEGWLYKYWLYIADLSRNLHPEHAAYSSIVVGFLKSPYRMLQNKDAMDSITKHSPSPAG
jgi:hypothetical protein